MLMMTDVQQTELNVYVHVVRLLTLLLGLASCLLLHQVLGEIVGRWRQRRLTDMDLLTAGRNLERWVGGADNRSAVIHESRHGEWCITLRDPDLYLAGSAALHVYTSPTRRIPAAVDEAILQVQRIEEAPVI